MIKQCSSPLSSSGPEGGQTAADRLRSFYSRYDVGGAYSTAQSAGPVLEKTGEVHVLV